MDFNKTQELERNIELKKEAYEMGQNGRKAVIEEFSWDSQAIGYLNVIKDIL